MNCRKVNSLLSAYIDGELPGVERLTIQRHMRDCDSCSNEYESLLFTKRLLSNLKVQSPPVSLEQQILQKLDSETGSQLRMNIRDWWNMQSGVQRTKLMVSATCATVSIAICIASFTHFRPTDANAMTASRTQDMPVTLVQNPSVPQSPQHVVIQSRELPPDYLSAHRAWTNAQPVGGGPTITPADSTSVSGVQIVPPSGNGSQ